MMIQARVMIWCWSVCPELWDVFCEHLWKNWPPYNGTALYIHVNIYMSLPVTYYCLFVINILLPLVQTLDSSVWAPGLMKTATFGLHWPTLDRRTWDSGSSVWYVWPFFFYHIEAWAKWPKFCRQYLQMTWYTIGDKLALGRCGCNL